MNPKLYNFAHSAVQECNAEVYCARQKMFADVAARLVAFARSLHEIDGKSGEELTHSVDDAVRVAAHTIASEADGFNLFRNFDFVVRRLYEEMAETIERDGIGHRLHIVSNDDDYRGAYLENAA